MGCSTLGSSHSWGSVKLQDRMHFTDQNWPRVAVSPHGSPTAGSFLPGGDHRHTQLLRCPVDRLPVNPTTHQQPNYSLSRDKRWWGCKENGEIDKQFQQNRQPPGPGNYCKSAPRGPHFVVDAGETVVLGANHPCPWKSSLGHSINPTNADILSGHHSSAKWSFSKTRRSCSETHLGHGQQAGGPVKSDEGCLSPGHVYEMYSTFSQSPGLKGKRNVRSAPKMRVVMVPPEAEPGNAPGVGDDDEFDPMGEY